VVELESLLVDARAQIDSLKSARVVTNEPECTDCSVFLDELIVLKENYASKVEELDLLRVALDEMNSRPSLLGACTSCPVLHEKLDVSLVYARSLEAQLKAPMPTSCSTCDMHTPASSTTPTTLPTSSTTLPTSTPTPTGPITRCRAKKIQQEVHALLCELKLNYNDNFMLPKSCMLILLRYVEENHQDEGHEARIGKVLVIQQGHSAISQSIRQSIRQFPEA
jgi:hypothetical protein